MAVQYTVLGFALSPLDGSQYMGWKDLWEKTAQGAVNGLQITVSSQ